MRSCGLLGKDTTHENKIIFDKVQYEGWTSKLIDRQIQLLKSFDIFRRWWVLTIILQKCFIILSADSIVVSCRNLLDENSQSYLLKWSRRYRLYIINSKNVDQEKLVIETYTYSKVSRLGLQNIQLSIYILKFKKHLNYIIVFAYSIHVHIFEICLGITV